MRLPNKITSYSESALSKFPFVLDALKVDDLTPSRLYGKMKSKVDGIDEFYEILDGLYALGAVELIMPKGVLHYVG